MSILLESKKMRRTGFFPAWIGGGLAGAAVPAVFVAVRANPPGGGQSAGLDGLLAAVWPMMAMLNVLLICAGACLAYHTEHANNGMQKMCTLPLSQSGMFLGKFALLATMSLLVLALEAVATALCAAYQLGPAAAAADVAAHFAYTFTLSLPVALLSLLIAACCKNMWVSLGICVVCVFAATMLPTDNFALSLFAFALPFQRLAGRTQQVIHSYLLAVAAQLVVITAAHRLFLRIRRWF